MEKIGGETRFQDEAVKSSDLVVVAVPKEYYNTLPLDSFDGKTIIDVSNRNSVKRKMEM